GQNFGGRYNPMGPDKGPGFVQHYNHTAMRFSILDDGKELRIVHSPSASDSLLLHRRDYNLLPQIFPDGKEGLTAFSGVFQYKADIPWLHCLDIHGDDIAQIPGFLQYYNHYHCAKIPLFSAQANEMHNLFFGGIAAYYDSLGMLTHNRDVPFVKTISRVTRDAGGKVAEYKLPVEMPGYLGASAEFIPLPGLPQYPNGVIQLDALEGGNVLLGHIVGGIDSNDDNVFWVNEGDHSKATPQVWKVYLRRNPNAAQDILNTHSISPMRLQVLPNPFKGLIEVDLNMVAFGNAEIQLFKGDKKLLLHSRLMNNPKGPLHWISECKQLKKGGLFTLLVTANGETARMRMVVER
ncbi:MAG TPA: T9SS C-terminal target domain-containing protein, partial [Bacteroidia bacterium]|nr:T9SS C-terminal target domain-containing protein [Bacteroidia bacterium]